MKVRTYKRLVSAAEDAVKTFESGNKQKYRVVTSLWKYMLLNNMDSIKTCNGHTKLIGKSIGAGVWELSLEDN